MSCASGPGSGSGTCTRPARTRRGCTWTTRPTASAAPDVAGYLFFGGLAGASSVLAASAQRSGHRELARVAKVSALGAISLSAAALVHDLGRPGRFTHMLRVFKPSSPMSVGSWLLAG